MRQEVYGTRRAAVRRAVVNWLLRRAISLEWPTGRGQTIERHWERGRSYIVLRPERERTADFIVNPHGHTQTVDDR